MRIYCINICMKENPHWNNIFLRTAEHSPAPWRVKMGFKERPVIEDLYGVELGHLERLGKPEVTPDQYKANWALLAHAPQLLAALKELVFFEITEGRTPKPQLIELLAAAENITPEKYRKILIGRGGGT
jgi:hypothetical protein